MSWESFYLICFLVGFLLSLISLAGQVFHIHGHFGHGHHGHLHAGQGHGLAKLNFSTICAFLTWFGAAGYLMQRHTAIVALFEVAISVFAGIAGAAIVFWFMTKLMAHDRTLDPADYDMVGVLGRVTSPVRPGGVGEIVFARDGGRKSAAVRCEDGSGIDRNVEVIVTRYENGIAYVKKWDELAG